MSVSCVLGRGPRNGNTQLVKMSQFELGNLMRGREALTQVTLMYSEAFLNIRTLHRRTSSPCVVMVSGR